MQWNCSTAIKLATMIGSRGECSAWAFSSDGENQQQECCRCFGWCMVNN